MKLFAKPILPQSLTFTPAMPPLAVSLLLAGCASSMLQQEAARKEIAYAVTTGNQLISFNAGKPGKLLFQKKLTGLQPGEVVSGIDYRVAKGQLYALGSTGRIYRVDTPTATATMVGPGPLAVLPYGTEVGFDFNPTVDRIRIVGSTGLNMRAHPDTGAAVDGDANTAGIQPDTKLTYAMGDAHAGKVPQIGAAAYTYNKDNDKITTNYAIDAAMGVLVTQGTLEGKVPSVSPNTGQLFTVGALGTGRLTRVSFDIADVSGDAYMAAEKPGQTSTSWYQIDLRTGKATSLGAIGINESVVGVAIEP